MLLARLLDLDVALSNLVVVLQLVGLVVPVLLMLCVVAGFAYCLHRVVVILGSDDE